MLNFGFKISGLISYLFLKTPEPEIEQKGSVDYQACNQKGASVKDFI